MRKVGVREVEHRSSTGKCALHVKSSDGAGLTVVFCIRLVVLARRSPACKRVDMKST